MEMEMDGDCGPGTRCWTRAARRTALTGLVVVCAVLLTAQVALAESVPEVVVAEGDHAVTWKAAGLPAGWGYKVAVAQCQEKESSCEHPDHVESFEVEKTAAPIQSFVPYAQNIIDFSPIGGRVYIGVAVLQQKGQNPLGEYSAPRTPVLVADEPKLGSGVFGAPPLVWSEGESVDWNSVAGTEWGYKVAVSREPQCFPLGGPKCRDTEQFEVPLSAQNPQSFAPCLGRVKFEPIGGTVYVGVGTLKAPSTNPASYSGSEVSVKVSECPPPEVASISATSIALTSAQLNGAVNPKGSIIKACRFEYGTTEAYGASVECAKFPPGEGNTGTAVSAPLVGLAPGTTYHYRLAAQGGLTSHYGVSGDTIFTTTATPVVVPPPRLPVDILAPTVSGSAIANLSLSASPGAWENQPTSYAYQWQRCDASGASCVEIAGASLSSFTPSDADVGHRLRVLVTAQNKDGAATASSGTTPVVGSTVEADVRWGVRVQGSYTIVTSVEVSGIPRGGVVEASCQGHGCPFRVKQITAATRQLRCRRHHCKAVPVITHGQADLGYLLRRRHLRPGAVLITRVIKAGWIGRGSQIVIGANRPPRRPLKTCLAPGSPQPVSCPA
jgi:hypothetical protein